MFAALPPVRTWALALAGIGIAALAGCVGGSTAAPSSVTGTSGPALVTIATIPTPAPGASTVAVPLAVPSGALSVTVNFPASSPVLPAGTQATIATSLSPPTGYPTLSSSARSSGSRAVQAAATQGTAAFYITMTFSQTLTIPANATQGTAQQFALYFILGGAAEIFYIDPVTKAATLADYCANSGVCEIVFPPGYTVTANTPFVFAVEPSYPITANTFIAAPGSNTASVLLAGSNIAALSLGVTLCCASSAGQYEFLYDVPTPNFPSVAFTFGVQAQPGILTLQGAQQLTFTSTSSVYTTNLLTGGNWYLAVNSQNAGWIGAFAGPVTASPAPSTSSQPYGGTVTFTFSCPQAVALGATETQIAIYQSATTPAPLCPSATLPPASPSPSPSPSPTPGPLTASVTSLTFTTTGTSAQQQFTLAESGYSGTYTVVAKLGSASPVTASVSGTTVTVVPTQPGSDTLVVTDQNGKTLSIPVSVIVTNVNIN